MFYNIYDIEKKIYTKYLLNIYKIINIILKINILHIQYSLTIALSNLKIAQLPVKGITESSISLTTFTFLYSTFNQIHDITKIKILFNKLKVIFHRKKVLSIFSITSIHRNGKKKIDPRSIRNFSTIIYHSMSSFKKENSVLSERKKHR